MRLTREKTKKKTKEKTRLVGERRGEEALPVRHRRLMALVVVAYVCFRRFCVFSVAFPSRTHTVDVAALLLPAAPPELAVLRRVALVRAPDALHVKQVQLTQELVEIDNIH